MLFLMDALPDVDSLRIRVIDRDVNEATTPRGRGRGRGHNPRGRGRGRGHNSRGRGRGRGHNPRGRGRGRGQDPSRDSYYYYYLTNIFLFFSTLHYILFNNSYKEHLQLKFKNKCIYTKCKKVRPNQQKRAQFR